MRSEKNKINTIVGELLNNSLRANATDIDINVSLTDEIITITASDNGDGMDEEKVKHAKDILNQPYKKELEEQFGQLAGMDVSSGGGLNIIGMQVNDAEIESVEGKGTKVILNKSRTKK